MTFIIIHKGEILPFCSREHAIADERYQGWVGSIGLLDAPTKCGHCGARMAWSRFNIYTYQIEKVSPEAEDWAEAF